MAGETGTNQAGYGLAPAPLPDVIKILKLSGDSNEVNFSDEDNVLDFKKKVEAACAVEVGRQRLVLGDKVLKPDSEKIVKLGVQPGIDVTLFIKRFPPPSRKDKAKIQALMAAGDFEGLQQAAVEGYELSVENGLYDVLHTAASNGDYDMVEMMLETGVSVFAITRQNPKTALQVAAKYGKKDVCELLIQWGLDPHEKNKLTSDGSNRRIETWDAVQYAHNFPELAAWLAAQPSPTPQMATEAECQQAITNQSENVRSYSSVYNDDAIGTGHARSKLDSAQAWSADINAVGQYMTIDLGSIAQVRGVVTQARGEDNQYVKTFIVKYSTDGVSWRSIKESVGTKTKTFSSASSAGSQKFNAIFPAVVNARFVKLIVQSWTSWISMRAGIIMDKLVCEAGEQFAMDISVTDTHWEVRLMGKPYPSLSYERQEGVRDGTGVELLAVPGGEVKLFANEVPDPGWLRSVNSKNGCFNDMFKEATDAGSFYFTLVPTGSMEGQLCIRCESKPFDTGSNIYLENGKMVVSIEGNEPRVQKFNWDFKAGLDPEGRPFKYDVLISYNRADSVLELYVSGSQKQQVTYTRAVQLEMQEGLLGCLNMNEKKFSGEILDYFTNHEVPAYRPLQARCSQHVCEMPQMKHKSTAFDIPCAGPVCTDADTTKCCDPMPKCTPNGYDCSSKKEYPYVFIHNAADIYCTDLGCENTPLTHCCAPKGSCATWPCPSGRMHKPRAADIQCSDDECTADDEVLCCNDVGRCSSYECPPGMTLNKDNAEMECVDRNCTVEDEDNCCVAVGTCDEFDCPPDTTLQKPDATEIECTDASPCRDTHWSHCCDAKAKCDTMNDTCPPNMIIKKLAQNIICGGLACDTQDETRCCQANEVCSDLICDQGFIPIKDATITSCTAPYCNIQDDHDKCCLKKGYCPSYSCPAPQYMQKHGAENIMCDDPDCSASNTQKCCGEKGKCSSYACPAHRSLIADAHDVPCPTSATGSQDCTANEEDLCCDATEICSNHKCPEIMVLKKTHAELHCAASKCASVDDDQCCVSKGFCPSYSCATDNMLHKHNAFNLLCAKETCQSSDGEATCCAAKNNCLSLQCPDGYAHNDKADELTCDGMSCELADRDHCCTQVASCSTYECPHAYKHYPNIHYLFCQGLQCLTHKDQHTCCFREGHCSGYDCIDNWIPKHNAHEILCDKRDCSPEHTPFEKCCAQANMCNAYHCPLGYVMKLNASVEPCEERLCTDKDLNKCCDEVAMCSVHKCPYGYTLNVNHANIMCLDRNCSDSDHDLCCVPEGHCYSFPCPIGQLHRHDKDLLCDDENCTNTDNNHCCHLENRCNTYKCPGEFLHKDGSEDIPCAGFKCNDFDLDTCCDRTGSCAGYDCPAGTVITWAPKATACSGVTCSDEDILDCCTSEGKCDSMKCPSGYQHRHDASDLFCSDKTCDKDETDFKICCVEDGHCHSFHCPDEFVHKDNASNLFCDDWLCVDGNDTDTCCDNRAHCNEDICQANHTLIWEAEDTMCKNRTCLDQDWDTCCNEEGKCNTQECPIGFNHRHDAGDIWCDDKTCTENDYHKCCAEQDMCHSYSCPERYVHKWNADELDCQGFVCDDTDKDTCCDHRAFCNEDICGHAHVQKSDAEIILCVNSTCDNEHDRDACCDLEATCLLKKCPEYYIHKAEASTILCKDANCTNTDEDTCCEKRAECLSHECASGYVQKMSSIPLYCKGIECSDTAANDTDICCVPGATCDKWEPPPGYFLRHKPATLHCQWSSCSDIDVHNCAAEPGVCSSFKCPNNPGTWVPKHNANEIECEDLDCLATDYKHCCVPEGSCASYRCKNGTAHKEDYLSRTCNASRCTDADAGECCETAEICYDATFCTSKFTLKALATEITCKGRLCDDAIDKNTCCVEDGMCSTFNCSALDLMHKHNASDIRCDDEDCTQTDSSKCCDEAGYCPTYKCPAKSTVHKHNADAVKCREELCTDADRYVCCDRRAKCDSMGCGPGKQYVTDHLTVYCKGKECEDVDIDTCCVPAVLSTATDAEGDLQGGPTVNETDSEASPTDDDQDTSTSIEPVNNTVSGRATDETDFQDGAQRIEVAYSAIFMVIAGLHVAWTSPS